MLLEQNFSVRSYDRLPIPNYVSIEGWKRVTIEERGEPLVSLQEYAPSVVLSPQYYYRKIPGSLERMYVREIVAQKLEMARHLLPVGYRVVVWDAWRPVEVQMFLFSEYKEKLMREKPGLSLDECSLLAQKYVSLPSIDHGKPSPHITGGAVDLTLQGPDATLLSMGTEFDDFTLVAGTRRFEDADYGQNGEIVENRRLLYWVMNELGFTNYPEEWWHFDYGNQFYGKIKGETAIYGLIFPD